MIFNSKEATTDLEVRELSEAMSSFDAKMARVHRIGKNYIY